MYVQIFAYEMNRLLVASNSVNVRRHLQVQLLRWVWLLLLTLFRTVYCAMSWYPLPNMKDLRTPIYAVTHELASCRHDYHVFYVIKYYTVQLPASGCQSTSLAVSVCTTILCDQCFQRSKMTRKSFNQLTYIPTHLISMPVSGQYCG